MLRLLDMNKITQNLIPVTTSEYFVGKSHTFHPDGLFSENIFGAMETPDRRKTYSYIDLNCRIFHPALFPILRRLEQKIIKIMNGKTKYNIDEQGNLVEDHDGEISTVNHVIDNFDKLKFRSEGQKVRSDFIDMIEYYKKKNMIFIDKQLIIPPNFRDITIGDDGEVTVNPLNEYYIKVIRHSQQLRSITSGPMYDILVNRMNDLVLEIYTYITSKISKKSGLLRQSMLGKRIDFTARAVISGSSYDIKPNQIGVPLKLLVKLFEPFLLFELINSGTTNKELLAQQLEAYNGSPLNAMTLKRLFIGMSKGDEIPNDLYNTLGEAMDRTIRGKVVIAKRDPALHAESVQAFEPVRITGNTIKLHPLKCTAFNADFDGDQMALYVPITRQAIEEANEKMVVAKSKDGMGQMIDDYNKDTCIGIYVLTQDPPGREKPPPPSRLKKVKGLQEVDENQFYEWVQYGKYVTTVGRMIFNSVIPTKYRFINEPVNKKKLNKLANAIFNSETRDEYNNFADLCVKIAYKFGTLASPSFCLDDLEIPKYIYDLKDKLKDATPQESQTIIDDMESKMKEYLETKMGNLGTIGKAGGLKGGYSQARQILVAKGLISDNEGNILAPIKESYGEGFESKDFFKTGAGSRKGIADRVLNTAETGYLSRQLVYALQRVEADPRIFDCKTKRPYMIKVTPDIAKRLIGRYMFDPSGKVVKIDQPSALIGKMIPLKSPLYCKTPKICRICYGDLLLRNESPYVGMLAAQVIGERGTQLIMKCSSGLVHHDNKLWAFEDLWNYFNVPIELIDGKMTKQLSNISVEGKDSPVNAITIQKHQPTNKLLFISTKGGHNLIVQSNHPLWIKKNPIHSTFSNDKCRLVGNEVYKEYQSTRKLFDITDKELIEIEAKSVQRYDAIWVDTSIALNNTEDIEPCYTGYLCGIYCAEGFKVGTGGKTKGNGISQVTRGPIRDKILVEAQKQYERVSDNRDYIVMFDNSQSLSNIVLGNYAWEKRLDPDFINYSKSWLRDFICGLIDGDGSVTTNGSTVCRVYTSSHYLMQQLKAICVKLGYKMNSCLVPVNRPGQNSVELKRPSFACDISFVNDPKLTNCVKLADHPLVYVSQRKEEAIKGFDIISNIKEIKLWEYPVYDIQTETSEFMMNMVQNHNSFHTGGAVSVVTINIMDSVSDQLIAEKSKYFVKYFEQVGNKLVAKIPGRLFLKKSEYLDPKHDIKRTSNDVTLEYGYFYLETPQMTIDVTLDTKTIIDSKQFDIKEDDQTISFIFKSGDVLFECPPTTDSMLDKVKVIKHLLSGKKPYRSGDHFCNKILDQYLPLSDTADLVQFEILATHLLRDSRNLSYPARLSKDYSATIISLKKIPLFESWLSALSFENPSEAISTGLIYDREHSESVLEQIVNGTL